MRDACTLAIAPHCQRRNIGHTHLATRAIQTNKFKAQRSEPCILPVYYPDNIHCIGVNDNIAAHIAVNPPVARAVWRTQIINLGNLGVVYAVYYIAQLAADFFAVFANAFQWQINQDATRYKFCLLIRKFAGADNFNLGNWYRAKRAQGIRNTLFPQEFFARIIAQVTFAHLVHRVAYDKCQCTATLCQAHFTEIQFRKCGLQCALFRAIAEQFHIAKPTAHPRERNQTG